MKVLIIHPEFENPGGVASYNFAIRDKFSVDIKHFNIGKRLGENGLFVNIVRVLKDYYLFIKVLRAYDIVHINPSLNFKSVIRDGVFILLSKYFKKKVIVFFHGWNNLFEKKIHGITQWLFQKIYGKADAFIVLANEFKKKLIIWGFKQPVYIETTTIDDDLIKDIDMRIIIKKRMNDSKFRILFLSRILKEKGIYETIDAVNLLHSKYPNIELIVAGNGAESQRVKEYIKQKNGFYVIFTGYVKGETKKKIFEESSVYCFPTYGEGMPVSVLEALAFGLPVITRPVGGIADFFEQGKHGFITESKDPSIIASFIEKLYLDRELYKNVSLYNYQYAKERFRASKVTERLEKIYADVLHL